MDSHGSGPALHQLHLQAHNQHNSNSLPRQQRTGMLLQNQNQNLNNQQNQQNNLQNHNNHNNHHSSHHNSQHIVHAGWLMKSPPEKRIWKQLGKWRRRWFVLKLSGQIPGQYVLEYFVDPSCKKLKGAIDLDQCEQVDAGLSLEIRKTAENYDHIFDLRTAKRVYYLVACSEEEMNKWVECICSVCGLKIEAVASFGPSELSPLLSGGGNNVGNNGDRSELSPTPVSGVSSSNTNSSSTTTTEERYSPQPSVSGSDSMTPTVMAPTPPPPTASSSSCSSQQSSVVLLPPPPPLTAGQQRQPSPQLVHHHQSCSSNSSSNTPPSSSSSSSLASAVVPNNSAGNNIKNNQALSSLNDALLNYIPISECYTGTKPEITQHSPPPPRPPKPKALQLAGKSQSSLALWPAENMSNCSSNSPVNASQVPLLPLHPQKVILQAANVYGTSNRHQQHQSNNNSDPASLRMRGSPLQYSKSLAMPGSGMPPMMINDRPAALGGHFYFSGGSKGSSAGSLSLPPHNHNYEFCNANVVIGPNGTAFVQSEAATAPPLVNRSLKPHRRSASGRMDLTSSSPFGTQAARHTLPRPPPLSSYPNRGEDGRKSFNTNHHSGHHLNHGQNNSGHHSNTLSFSHQFGFEKNKKLPPFNGTVINNNNNQFHHSILSHLDHQESSEMQYLDLDLESGSANQSESTNSHSPKEGATSATNTSGVNGNGTSDSSLVSNNTAATSTNNTSGINHNLIYNVGNSQLTTTTWNIPPNSSSTSAINSLDPFTTTTSSNSLQNHNNNNNNASTPNANHGLSNSIIALIGKDNTSTVYKQVDFVKTKAFNKMRVDMDRNGFYRTGNGSANATGNSANTAGNSVNN